MKLQEVIKVPLQPNTVDTKAFDDAVQFRKAKVETYPLLAKQVGDRYFFKVQVDGEDAAFLIAETVTDLELNGKLKTNVLTIKRTWTKDKFKNKGLMTAMYNTLCNQGFTLISDIELSPQSLSIWKKLSSAKHVQALNLKTKECRKAVPDDFSKEDDQVVFVLEERGKWGPIKDNYLVEEYRIFVGQDCP